MQNTFLPSPSEVKYRSMRMTLLAVLLFSVINIFFLLGDSYFLFSAYLSQIISYSGVLLYRESGEIFFYIICAFLAFLTLVPYLLCFIFSKKRVGWMIAALAFFAIDSVIFTVDLISYPQINSIIDIIFRVYALVSLSLAVKYGLDAKKEAAMQEAAAAITVNEAAEDTETAKEGTENDPPATRSLIIRRKKGFVACAASVGVYINGTAAAKLKNGQNVTVTAPADQFTIALSLGVGNALSASSSFTIPAGEGTLDYTVSIKTGFAAANIHLDPTSSLK